MLQSYAIVDVVLWILGVPLLVLGVTAIRGTGGILGDGELRENVAIFGTVVGFFLLLAAAAVIVISYANS